MKTAATLFREHERMRACIAGELYLACMFLSGRVLRTTILMMKSTSPGYTQASSSMPSLVSEPFEGFVLKLAAGPGAAG